MKQLMWRRLYAILVVVLLGLTLSAGGLHAFAPQAASHACAGMDMDDCPDHDGDGAAPICGQDFCASAHAFVAAPRDYSAPYVAASAARVGLPEQRAPSGLTAPPDLRPPIA